MPTYSVNVDLKGIAPVPRHFCLDELMESLGSLPWRPGVPPEDQAEGNCFSHWECAGNPFRYCRFPQAGD